MSNIAIGAPVISTASIGPSQAELWPFPVNWDDKVTETIEFKTDIFKTRSRREQRRALRFKPRWSYSFATWTAAERYQRLSGLVRGRGGSQFIIRHPVDWFPLESSIDTGEFVLSVGYPVDWAQPGVHVILENGPDQELCRITDSSIYTVTINGAVLNDWPAGTRVRRALPARLDQSFSMQMITNNVASFDVNFMAEPDGTYELDSGTAADTFDGRELFLKRSNWNQGVALDFDFGRETIDYGVGRIAHNIPVNTGESVRKATYLGRTQDEVRDLIKFFLRMKGQRGEFYMPTFTEDIGNVISIAGGFIDVLGLDLYLSMLGDLTNRAVYAQKRDGTYLISKIDSVDTNVGNTRLTLDSSWGTVNLSSLTSISLVSLWRFATDVLSVDWLTSGVANVVMTFKSLENQVSE